MVADHADHSAVSNGNRSERWATARSTACGSPSPGLPRLKDWKSVNG